MTRKWKSALAGILGFMLLLALGTGCDSPVSQKPASSALPAGGKPLFAFLGKAHEAFAASYEKEPPVALEFTFSGIAGPRTLRLTDRAAIDGAFQAMQKTKVGKKSHSITTDNDSTFVFERKDGSKIAVKLNGDNLLLSSQTAMEAYELAGAGELLNLRSKLQQMIWSSAAPAAQSK